MSHTHLNAHRKRRTFVLFLILCSLAFRVVYTPIHLGHGEHLGAAWQAAHEASHTEHHHDHEHHDDHLPHPALDQAINLTVQRVTNQDQSFDLWALPAKRCVEFRMPELIASADSAERVSPSPIPRDTARPRGPPALV